MQTLSQIKQLLDERGLRPRHALGQNFLIDQNLIRRLIESSGVRSDSLVLEVGPGTGALTLALLETVAEVIACELDEGLADLVSELAVRRDNANPQQRHSLFSLIRGDCLAGKRTLNPSVADAIRNRPFFLVANLPYGAATPLLMTLMIAHPNCLGFAVTVQREVADRVLAPPGSPDYGVLSVVVQAVMCCRRIAVLPPECFWPRPEVTSAMIVGSRLSTPRAENLSDLAEFSGRMFQSRRKQIGTILGRTFSPPGGISASARPGELSVEQFSQLAKIASRLDAGPQAG